METLLNKTKTNDVFSVDPRNIVITEGFNIRKNFGDIRALADSIRELGIQVPLKAVRVKGGDTYRLIDGARRMTAVNLLLSEGIDFPYVPVIKFTGNKEDEVFTMIVTGTSQLQLNEVEQAEAVKRLLAYDYTVKDISVKIGKSIQSVYNLVTIANLPKNVKDKIVTGFISASTVLSINREESDSTKVKEKVDMAIKDAQASSTSGKIVKATNKNVSTLVAKTDAQKMKEVFQVLKAENVSNDKVAVLEMILFKVKEMNTKEIIEYFKG